MLRILPTFKALLLDRGRLIPENLIVATLVKKILHCLGNLLSSQDPVTDDTLSQLSPFRNLLWSGSPGYFQIQEINVCGNKMPTRCNRGFYCRSYWLLNMFRAPLCPSSGAQEYYTVVAACGISCCGFQVAGLVWSWVLCVRFAGCWFTHSGARGEFRPR